MKISDSISFRSVISLIERLAHLPFETSEESAEFDLPLLVLVCSLIIRITHIGFSEESNYHVVNLLPQLIGVENHKNFYVVVSICIALWQLISVALIELSPLISFVCRRRGALVAFGYWLTMLLISIFSGINVIVCVLFGYICFRNAKLYWRLRKSNQKSLEKQLYLRKIESSVLYDLIHFLIKTIKNENLMKVVDKSLQEDQKKRLN
jgi:hypothetical protein